MDCIFLVEVFLVEHTFGRFGKQIKNKRKVLSGNMLRSFEAHYKKINVIRITDDDNFVITGGLILIKFHSNR